MLDEQMSSGITFNGIQIADPSDLQQDYAKLDVFQYMTVPCDKGEVGWQWVYQTDDESVTAEANLFLCGHMYVGPSCPAFACANDNCTVCQEGW